MSALNKFYLLMNPKPSGQRPDGKQGLTSSPFHLGIAKITSKYWRSLLAPHAGGVPVEAAYRALAPSTEHRPHRRHGEE